MLCENFQNSLTFGKFSSELSNTSKPGRIVDPWNQNPGSTKHNVIWNNFLSVIYSNIRCKPSSPGKKASEAYRVFIPLMIPFESVFSTCAKHPLIGWYSLVLARLELLEKLLILLFKASFIRSYNCKRIRHESPMIVQECHMHTTRKGSTWKRVFGGRREFLPALKEVAAREFLEFLHEHLLQIRLFSCEERLHLLPELFVVVLMRHLAQRR